MTQHWRWVVVSEKTAWKAFRAALVHGSPPSSPRAHTVQFHQLSSILNFHQCLKAYCRVRQPEAEGRGGHHMDDHSKQKSTCLSCIIVCIQNFCAQCDSTTFDRVGPISTLIHSLCLSMTKRINATELLKLSANYGRAAQATQHASNMAAPLLASRLTQPAANCMRKAPLSSVSRWLTSTTSPTLRIPAFSEAISLPARI